MESKTKVFALAWACMIALFAPIANGQSIKGTIGELDDLQQQILIAKKRQELEALRREGPTEGLGTQRPGVRNSDSNEGSLPGVISVMGGGGKSLMAILDYGNGQTVNVRVGTSIPGGYRVEAIGVEEVVVSRDNERHRLAVGVPPPPSPAAQSSSAVMPRPLPGAGMLASQPFSN